MEVVRVEPFLEQWEKVRGRTRRVVDCIPPDRLEWTWKPGKFTLGDLVRHLAGIERWMYAENARQRPSRYPGHAEELASGWTAVREYFDRLHAEAMAIFRELSDADLAKRCVTPGGAEITVGKWLRLMFEHEMHHRGQIYLMLSMVGVETPPLHGLTSEQVRDRSLSAPEEETP